jgi:hemolysin activation/secretion protein
LPSGAESGRDPLRPVMPQAVAPAQTITVPQASAAEAPPGAENFSLTLVSFDIEGATAFTADDLRADYAGLVGQEVTVAQLFTAANAIEMRYRNAGYITSRVVVPAQTIEDGHFHVRVIEGFVSDIVYPTNLGPAMNAVRKLAEPLRGVTPISVAEIERRLLLADDLPGLTVRGNLEASPTEVGGSVVVLEVERKAYDASATFDNRNTPYTGERELSTQASWNSFGSNADMLSLSAKSSDPTYRGWSIGGSYQGTFGSEGLTWGFASSLSRSEPGLELDALDIRSRVVSEIMTVTYPVIRSRLQNLRLVSELEYRDISTDAGVERFNRDDLRILRAGVSYDISDTWKGITAVRATLHHGLDVMNATDQGAELASRERGRSDFTKATFDITRVQGLTDSLSLLATATTQFSAHSLLASEEIALGGPNFGRAYDEGEVSSDNGWAGLLELRYSPNLPDYFPNGIQFYTFVDAGTVWSKADDAGLAQNSVASVGGGVRLNLHPNLYGSLELDHPLDGPVKTEGDKPSRVFFNLTAHF